MVDQWVDLRPREGERLTQRATEGRTGTRPAARDWVYTLSSQNLRAQF